MLRLRRACVISAAVGILGWQATAVGSGRPHGDRGLVAQRVTDFDNRGSPLIQTLLQIAASYRLPMGIEKVVPVGVGKPIKVRMTNGTIAQLLDVCVAQSPGYSWAEEDGAIDVFGASERTDPSNLFNTVVRAFELRNETIDAGSDRLRTALLFETEKPKGSVGSYLGSPDLDEKRLTFTLRGKTVRQILNRMVALHGDAVWIARVPPDRLSHVPDAGLWALLPRSVQDPRQLLKLGPPDTR
jgi:hypothetical protein